MGGVITIRNLLSPEYEGQIRELHSQRIWGEHGHIHAKAVRNLIKRQKAKSVLDYGCGTGTLRESLRESLPGVDVREYDPGIIGKDGLPEKADIVVVTDVLEHIEPDYLEAVLAHIHSLTGKACFAAIATRPANAILPNGENAHLIVKRARWWQKMLNRWAWRQQVLLLTGDDLILILYKK